MKKTILILLFGFLSVALIACGGKDFGSFEYGNYNYFDEDAENNESYLEIVENQFVETLVREKSHFSLDTSTAGYANIRRMINNKSDIPHDAVKIEEMVNYFSYDYDAPTTDDALSISAEIMDTPWNSNTKLLSIGVKAKEIDLTNKKASNIVLLLDVSGSMYAANKLPLLQSAFKLFVETLDDNDTISIVTYAGSQRVLLNGAKGFEKTKIMAIIEDLEAGGSTAGSKGIETAYEIAKENFIEGGHNRVIIGTDGDFNVGISSRDGLENFISEKRDEEDIYLSVLGFGEINLKDDNLETLANAGNGHYSYIDTITEARKVLVEEIGGTLNIVSKDTKTQVTFNPRYVKEYRLLGYENKLLTQEEYDDEATDAGEIGAGHTTTAVYELVLNTDEEIESTLNTSWLDVEISYKDPETNNSKKVNRLVDESFISVNPSDDILFISAVIEFSLILRDSKYKEDANLDSLIARVKDLSSVKSDVYKTEFVELINKYKAYN